MATFTRSGAWTEAGVKFGNYTFRSFPLPNHPGQYFSLFAFSYDLPVDTPISVYASNPSGAIAKTTFWYKVFPKKFRASTIPLESICTSIASQTRSGNTQQKNSRGSRCSDSSISTV